MQIQGSTVHIDTTTTTPGGEKSSVIADRDQQSRMRHSKSEDPINIRDYSHKVMSDGRSSSEPDVVGHNDTDVNPVHREILEKLKHEENNGSSPRLDSSGVQDSMLADRLEADRRRLIEFQTAALKYKFPNGSLPTQSPDHLLRQREAFYAMQSGRPKLDYLSQIAFLQEQQSQLLNGHSQPRSLSPPTGSDESEVDSIQVETTSPTHASGQWTYEEQFKQLYELGDEPDRKKFLDDLFAYMQKRGTPVNRIPIMAKQTLDMYQLFKLVVSKGGLVEVINKKLWREITKGLNLPSSITSAAFTLRTQYMKYIYPYECEKYGFSTPAELQAAIDGNRREGRRPGYGYEMSPQGMTAPFYNPQGLTGGNPFFNPAALMGSPMATMLQNTPLGSNFINGRHTPNRVNGVSSTGSSVESRDETNHSPISATSPRVSSSAFTSTRPAPDSETVHRDFKRLRKTESPTHMEETPSPSSSEHKHMGLTSNVQKVNGPIPTNVTMGSTHLKITSHNDGRSEFDNSLVVSMDINGIMYQGVLFAQPKKL